MIEEKVENKDENNNQIKEEININEDNNKENKEEIINNNNIEQNLNENNDENILENKENKDKNKEEIIINNNIEKNLNENNNEINIENNDKNDEEMISEIKEKSIDNNNENNEEIKQEIHEEKIIEEIKEEKIDSKKLEEEPEIIIKSKEEDKIFMFLTQKFKTVIRQYRSDVYPFACDFYIPEIDLYIEYQGFWTHGKEVYNENNPQHLKIIQEWQQKSQEINFKKKYKDLYKNAIYIWTKKDPMKRKIAKENKLNWIEFFTFEDFEKWYKQIVK